MSALQALLARLRDDPAVGNMVERVVATDLAFGLGEVSAEDMEASPQPFIAAAVNRVCDGLADHIGGALTVALRHYRRWEYLLVLLRKERVHREGGKLLGRATHTHTCRCHDMTVLILVTQILRECLKSIS